MATTQEEASALRDVAIIVALSAVVLVPSLFTRDPWNPDEPRYAEVAREMVVTGNYAVPHLNGEVYPDKPAFFFCLVAGLMRLGFGFAAGRVLAALAATGTLLLVYGLGRRLYGRDVGLMAALATLTTLLFAWICKLGVIDPPLTFCVVAAIACGHRALEGGQRRGLWWLAVYAAAGVGVLIKGPVAVAVPAMVLAAYGIARRREAEGGGWWHLAGAGLLLAVVAAGMAPSLIKGGAAYANEIVFGQTAQRFTERASHSKPFFFFLASWPLYFLPWSLLVPLALVSAIRAARRGERGSWLPALWLIAVLALFSIPTGKRERYILPVTPAVGLLVARYTARVARGHLAWPTWHAWLWRLTLICGAVVAVGVGTAVLSPGSVASHFEADAEAIAQIEAMLGPGRTAAALTLSAGLVAAVFCAAWRLRDPTAERRRVMLAVAAALAFSLVGDLVAVPVADRFKSGRDLIERARPFMEAAEETFLFDSDYSGVYNLFSGRVHFPVLEEASDLEAALASRRRIAVIAREKRLGKLAGLGLRVAVRERVGSKKMVLLVNWDPAPAGPPP